MCFMALHLLHDEEHQCALLFGVTKCAGVSVLSSVRGASSCVMLMVFNQS